MVQTREAGMSAASELAHRLNAKRSGDGWKARCPAHDDHTASLKIDEGENDKLLLYCHAGCAFDAILKAAGVETAKPNGEANGKGRIVATYDYQDATGKLAFQVVRFEPKDFRQRAPNGVWSVKDIEKVPYRLPELLNATEVFICEGEKDCNSLAKIGLVATTNPGGADANGEGGKKWPESFGRYFHGRHAILLPDNDDPGRQHVQAVARKLNGRAASIRVVELPGLPPKGDVSDWLAAGGTRDKLEEMAAAAPYWQPNGEDKKPDRLRLVPPSEMDWRGAQLNLVKGLLGHGMMALLYGESGSAKTLIALSLALHVALGEEWCGRKVQKGFVAYLAPEGGHSVHLRFHAWCRHHKIDPSDDTLPFRTIPVSVDLCTSVADLTQIIANIKAAEVDLGPCVLAVVDTVSRALAGANENGPDDMGKFVLNCDRLREETGATVLGVHHTPKGGTEPRGHTCLKNGSEIRMLAEKVAHKLFKLNLEHLKDGPAGDELIFELASAVVGKNEDGENVEGGLVIHSDIPSPGAHGGKPPKLNERQLCLRNALHKEAFSAKKWDFTADEFGEICIKSGAIDATSPERYSAPAKARSANAAGE
jgi:hypothetical protein